MNELEIKKLVPGIILKANHVDPCYVVNIVGTEKIALLPKELAQKSYTVGQPFFATVAELNMQRTILTQKDVEYYKHIVMGAISYLKKKIFIKDIATVNGADFVKVSLDTKEEISDIAKKCINYFKRHLSLNVAFIKYSSNKEEYIINSLAPATNEHIKYTRYYPEESRMEVYVPRGKEGIVLGKNGYNVACAAKLTESTIQIISI